MIVITVERIYEQINRVNCNLLAEFTDVSIDSCCANNVKRSLYSGENYSRILCSRVDSFNNYEASKKKIHSPMEVQKYGEKAGEIEFAIDRLRILHLRGCG